MEARRRSWRQKHEDAEPRGFGERQEGSGEGGDLERGSLDRVAWPPRVGSPAEPAEAWAAAGEGKGLPAARQQASPLCSQPWTSCTLSPSPRTPLGALPAVTWSHALGVTHSYTCPSPCSTQPRQGLLACQGGETDWGHLHAWDPVPCGCRGRSHNTPGAPGPSAGWTFPWSHWFSADSLPQPPCSFHTPDGSQGPSESLSSGFPAGMTDWLPPAGPTVPCSFRLTLDPRNPLPPAPQTEAPRPERDSGGPGRGRQNGLSGQ